jgi:hypothetical protein
MGVLVFGGLGGSGESPTPSASASTSASAEPSEPASVEASASSAASASAAPSETPASSPASLELDTIVAATVSDLSVRSGPGTSQERLGSLAAGTPGYVVDGPVDAEGYRWYLLSALGLPPNTGCAGPIENDPFDCPVWFGWVATGSAEAPWLSDDAGDADACAGSPFDFEDIVIGVTDLMRLHCFGSDPFTFRAWWPEGDPDVGACASQDSATGWLICQQINENLVTIGEDQGPEGIGLRVSIDPASGVTMPGRGTWLELTVHLDDPASQGCGEDAQGADAEERTPEQIVLFCRGQMVVETVSAVDGP